MNKSIISDLVAKEEAYRCLLCYDAPCSKVCPANSNPAEFIRSIRFDNDLGAVKHLTEQNCLPKTCSVLCNGKNFCEKVCVRNKIDSPIEIQKLHRYVAEIDYYPTYDHDFKKEKGISFVTDITSLMISLFFVKSGYQMTVCLEKGLEDLLKEQAEATEYLLKDLDNLKANGLTIKTKEAFDLDKLQSLQTFDFLLSSYDITSQIKQFILPAYDKEYGQFVQKMAFSKRIASKLIKELEV